MGLANPTAADVERVCAALEARHQSPRLGNPTEPLDVLSHILLSNRTAPAVARPVYEQFRREFPNWRGVGPKKELALRAVMQPAGLAVKRTAQFLGIAKTLRSRFGRVTLDPLGQETDEAAEAVLCELPGVSEKVAKCVLMYGFDREVLPVDVHVHRITRRLGWHDRSRADQTHGELEALVAPRLRYGFHVNAVAHGRSVCRPREPACGECPLSALCKPAPN